MHFAFDDDQLAMRDAVAALLPAVMGPAELRAAWTAAPGELDRRAWQQLVDMGVTSAMVSESSGGLGLDERSLVLVVEEAGRVGLPHPLVESALVAAPLLDDDLEGAMVATDLGGPHVPCARDADAFLLTGDGGRLVLFRRSEVEIEPVPAVDGGRRLGRVVPHASGEPVGGNGEIEEATRRGAVGVAALLLGLGGRMLDLTVQHVSEREQFGVPVGSFQAVKHQLADALKDLTFARPLVHRAAWSSAVGALTADDDAAMAKLAASEAADRVGRVALQGHGAIGYTVEYDLHLYLKRAWALVRWWGSPVEQRARLASSLYF